MSMISRPLGHGAPLRRNGLSRMITVVAVMYCILVVVFFYAGESGTQRGEKMSSPESREADRIAENHKEPPIIPPGGATRQPVLAHGNDVKAESIQSRQRIIAQTQKIIRRVEQKFKEQPPQEDDGGNAELQHLQDLLDRAWEDNMDVDDPDDVDAHLEIQHRGPDLVGMVKAMSDGRCEEYRRAASLQRLVIPDILEHAQYLPCDIERVTLIAHMSDDRISRFEQIFQHWNGPLSISLYVSMERLKSAVERILAIEGLMDRHNVLLHVVPEQGVIYPINYLRNVAINNTCTRFIFLSDIDFVPMAGSHNILLEDLQRSYHQRRVYVVPAFEEKRPGSYNFPQNKEDLRDLWDEDIITPFHIDKFPPGHHRTDFIKWRKTRRIYPIDWEPLFEPYIAGDRQKLPKYSQLFVGRGKNKIQQIVETIAMGLKLFVHPEVFMVHLEHEKSRSSMKQHAFDTCSNKEMTKFDEYILKKYGFTGQ